jgi:hypothetical protein
MFISLLCQPIVVTFALTFIISPRYKFAVCNLPFTEKINYRKQLDATQNAT